jgi:hypothetical protein
MSEHLFFLVEDSIVICESPLKAVSLLFLEYPIVRDDTPILHVLVRSYHVSKNYMYAHCLFYDDTLLYCNT